MNILIVAGGTGSIQIQQGLHAYLGELDGVKIQVLVNAYDNGLSTGAVRTVVNGVILGPSDVRKNQTTLLKIVDPKSPYHALLDIRFTVQTSEARQFCLDKIAELPVGGVVTEFNRTLLREAVEVYFNQKLSMSIDYNDFALANIIYAGFAIANGNSLRAAAGIMAQIMGLPKDGVILNDDTSLFLGAVTKSGVKLFDEGDIVKWGSIEDPIVDVFFTDANGNISEPVLCQEAKKAIQEADLIILSTGTQWSSLIPTYASKGFKEAIEASNADIVMLMNRQPDKDSPGQGADDIIHAIVPKYFPEKRIKLICDRNSPEMMRTISSITVDTLLKSFAVYMLSSNSEENKTLHSPAHTARAIMIEHFGDLLKSDIFMFDYDDTLVARGNSNTNDSTHAITGLLTLNRVSDVQVHICTGNSIKAISILDTSGLSRRIALSTFADIENVLLSVFADGGVNQYVYDPHVDVGTEQIARYKFVSCIAPQLAFPKSGDQSVNAIISRLQSVGIPRVKIENRGDVMISIRPIDSEYRTIVTDYIKWHLILGHEAEHGITVRPAGRSTIEICNKNLSKSFALHKILSDSSEVTVTYVGDELYNGNDEPIRLIAQKEPRVQFLNVKSIAHTAVFLRAVLSTRTITH